MASEEDRTRLIGEIARMLREDEPVPEDAKAAALTFIGWLARRKACEIPHNAGVAELLGRQPRRISFSAPVTHDPPRSERVPTHFASPRRRAR